MRWIEGDGSAAQHGAGSLLTLPPMLVVFGMHSIRFKTVHSEVETLKGARAALDKELKSTKEEVSNMVLCRYPRHPSCI